MLFCLEFCDALFPFRVGNLFLEYLCELHHAFNELLITRVSVKIKNNNKVIWNYLLNCFTYVWKSLKINILCTKGVNSCYVLCSAIIKTIKNFVNAIKIFVNQIVSQNKNKNKNFVNAIKIFISRAIISRLVELFSFSRDLVANFVTTKESLASNFSHIR